MALQKQFRGVNDYLGRYRGGALNFELAPNIAPTFDITQYMEPPRLITAEHSAISTGGYYSAFAAPVVIPDDELWVVSLLSAVTISPVPAGVSCMFSPVANLPSLIERVCLGGENSSTFKTSNAGVIGMWGTVFETPLVFEPGAQVGMLCSSFLGAGAMPTQIGMRYQIIKI